MLKRKKLIILLLLVALPLALFGTVMAQDDMEPPPGFDSWDDVVASADGGSIDLIWINGENFFTLKQADLLFDPWAETILNSALVNWDNPAMNLDFGRPVEGMESPWSGAQFHFIYDSAHMDAEDLPRSYAVLTEWIEAIRSVDLPRLINVGDEIDVHFPSDRIWIVPVHS